jgi:hypothetical protein
LSFRAKARNKGARNDKTIEQLQAMSKCAFSFKKFLNETASRTVFMSEGRHVVAGEAILSAAATIERSSEEMLEALVRQHSRLVYRIAYAVLRRHHDAEDATQETFMRVLRYSSKLSAVEDPKTWLARIAWRVAVDRSRQRGRTREIALEHRERPVKAKANSESSGQESLPHTEARAQN